MRPIITTICFLLIGEIILAQNDSSNKTGLKHTQIEYDLSTGQFNKIPSLIKEGSLISLSYKKVNRYALKSYATITSGTRIYTDGLTALQTGLSNLLEAQKTTDTQQEEAKTTPNDSTKKSVPAGFFKGALYESRNRYLERKLSTINDIITLLNDVYTEIIYINALMGIDKDIVNATSNRNIFDASAMKAAIFLNGQSIGVTTPKDFSVKLQEKVKDINSKLINIRFKLLDLQTNMEQFGSDQAVKEKEKLEAILKTLDNNITEIENAYKGTNLQTLQNNAADMACRAFKLINQDFKTPAKTIGIAKGDFVEIRDKLVDNENREILEIMPIKIKTYGGSRVDFSVGLAVNIGGHGQAEYALRKNPTNAASGSEMDSIILLTDDDDQLFKFSPVINVHWYRTTIHAVQWMLTAGLTPDFSNLEDTRFSLGTSIGFPSTNELSRRLVLSAGISFGYASVLKTKYKDLDNYKQFGELESEELTKKAIKPGAIFSISYNIGGIGHSGSN